MLLLPRLQRFVITAFGFNHLACMRVLESFDLALTSGTTLGRLFAAGRLSEYSHESRQSFALTATALPHTKSTGVAVV